MRWEKNSRKINIIHGYISSSDIIYLVRGASPNGELVSPPSLYYFLEVGLLDNRVTVFYGFKKFIYGLLKIFQRKRPSLEIIIEKSLEVEV